jgi:predicted nucleic acid-binding protein
MTVVCNTSPLLVLAKIQRLGLLTQLYARLVIPGAVVDEVGAKAAAAAAQIQALVATPRVTVQRATPQTLAGLPVDLGPGEREAIALALEIAADLVVLDDQVGRRLARARGLQVTGTVGVLVEAWSRGLLPALRPELDRLRDAGLWLADAFYQRLCQTEGA